MRTIIITGGPECGKSFCIFHLVKGWVDKQVFKEKAGMLKPEDEFLYAGRKYVEGESDLCGVICMADNEHFHILIVAATDNELCMHRVKRSLKTLEEQEIVPDILITTCRRFDSQEFKMMSEITTVRRKIPR